MRFTTGLVAGVILTGLALVCLPTIRLAQAETDDHTGAQSKANASISATALPLESNWKIGDPIIYDNLTIFPVTTGEHFATDDFITLDEGLKAGTVIVTELAASEPARSPARQANRIPRARVEPNQVQVQQQLRGDGARVNTLALTNKSGKNLVLIAGEMVTGGKQDRIVAHDCIIASSDTPVPLDVFCVEHGRWTGEAQFNKGGSGAGNGKSNMMASPKVRANAQAKKDQSEVWNGVAEQVTKNRVATSTGDLKSVYQDKRVSDTLESYDRQFKDKLTDKDIIGVVVAINGRVVSADVFANPKLFQAYWPKMFKSYALEAVSADKKGEQKATVKAAEAFLARTEGSKLSTGKDGTYKLTEHQSDADASFELEGEAKAAKTLVHFNRVSKK